MAIGTCSSSLEAVVVYAHGNSILLQDLAKTLLYLGALLYTQWKGTWQMGNQFNGLHGFFSQQFQ